MSNSLLIEIYTTEIPSSMQRNATNQFADAFRKRFEYWGVNPLPQIKTAYTPQRMVIAVNNLPERTPDHVEEHKGPRIDAPQKALDGFMRSASISSLDDCEQRDMGKKGTFYFHAKTVKGHNIVETFNVLLINAMNAINWPKSMRWGYGKTSWARPIKQALVIFHGKAIQDAKMLRFDFHDKSIPINPFTYGHRFLSPQKIPAEKIVNYEDYKKILAEHNVIIDPAERRDKIVTLCAELATKYGYTVIDDDGLLDEVTGLVEYPVPILGRIDPDFMRLPPEVLQTAMRVHQRYFSLQDKKGDFAPAFITVSNNRAPDGGKLIAKGNETVLRARLSDAKFFWDKDLDTGLNVMNEGLGKLTFHEKIGSMADMVGVIRSFASALAEQLNLSDTERADLDKAASLCKADLTSGMVDEFPNLQGVIGGYYAREMGLNDAVADAISEHYKPAGAKDDLPRTKLGAVLALAEKMAVLCALWAAGERATGSKDPYGLRRQAIGIIRLILDNGWKIKFESSIFPAAVKNVLDKETMGTDELRDAIEQFANERFINYTTKDLGYRHDSVNAIMKQTQRHITDKGENLGLFYHRLFYASFLENIKFIDAIRSKKIGEDALYTFNRCSSIVSKSNAKRSKYDFDTIDSGLLSKEDKNFYDELVKFHNLNRNAEDRKIIPTFFETLADLRPAVDAFFDAVMINDPDETVRTQRLTMLASVTGAYQYIIDLDQIEG